MKLVAKARPVQITKLRLGGRDINSKEELLQNFCVSEIIELGNKFIQWLDRHEDVKEYATPVLSIFNENKNKEKQVSDLLTLFFPAHKDQSLFNIVHAWHEKGTDNKVLFSLLNCISSNQLSFELMQNNILDKSWLKDWLISSNSNIYLSSDFCYHYGIFLKSIAPKDSYNWLKEAANKGHEKAIEMIQKTNGINLIIDILRKNSKKGLLDIEVKGEHIFMKKISNNNGDFYIAMNPLSRRLFTNINGSFSFENQEPLYDFHRCLDILSFLNSETGLEWDFPTEGQYIDFYNQHKNDNKSYSKHGEWCREPYKHCNLVMSMDGSKRWESLFCLNFFRPVLEISKNPSLQ